MCPLCCPLVQVKGPCFIFFLTVVLRYDSALKNLQIVLDFVRITAKAVQELIVAHGLSTVRYRKHGFCWRQTCDRVAKHSQYSHLTEDERETMNESQHFRHFPQRGYRKFTKCLFSTTAVLNILFILLFPALYQCLVNWDS